MLSAKLRLKVVSNITFLCPLKTSKILRFSDVFRGYSNVTLGKNELSLQSHHNVIDNNLVESSNSTILCHILSAFSPN